LPENRSISAFQTVSQLAGQRAVHRAFQWFHLQELKLREWHRQIASIPSPPFGEGARAQWLADRFIALGLEDVHIDDCGNTLGYIRGTGHGDSQAEIFAPRPCILLSAHLDTVFPSDVFGNLTQEGNRLFGPSVSDNCVGLTALLGIAASMRSADLQPENDILFAGNVGEEGEGNLRGMRYLFTESPVAATIRAAVVLDGAGTDSVVSHALGSKRFQVTIAGPGGHSWTDAGAPNPILVLANALADLGKMQIPESPRTTWNVGHVEGGTSINAIPQSVEARIDTRSTDPTVLGQLEKEIVRSIDDAVQDANARPKRTLNEGKNPPGVTFQIETIGERPAAALRGDAEILTILRAVDRHLGIPSQPRIASTDANIPLSLGIEAVSIGGGGTGGGIHTLQEWFDATGRELALRRILLLVLALSQTEIDER